MVPIDIEGASEVEKARAAVLEIAERFDLSKGEYDFGDEKKAAEQAVDELIRAVKAEMPCYHPGPSCGHRCHPEYIVGSCQWRPDVKVCPSCAARRGDA